MKDICKRFSLLARTAVVFGAIMLSNCGDNDIYTHLVGSYYYISKGGPSAVITTTSLPTEMVVTCQVVAYDYNDVFIVAKNERTDTCAWEAEGDSSAVGSIHYWIIDVKLGKVHGPLERQQYINMRQFLHVPDKLSVEL